MAIGAAGICLKHPIPYTPSVPMQKKTPKIWFCCFSLQAEGDGEGAGGYDPSAVVHGPCREGSGCDCEGVIRNQANVNSNGQGGLQKNEVLRLQCPP